MHSGQPLFYLIQMHFRFFYLYIMIQCMHYECPLHFWYLTIPLVNDGSYIYNLLFEMHGIVSNETAFDLFRKETPSSISARLLSYFFVNKKFQEHYMPTYLRCSNLIHKWASGNILFFAGIITFLVLMFQIFTDISLLKIEKLYKN
jgi:hypothetical protein